MNIQTARPRTPAETVLIDSFTQRVGELPGNADVAVARDTALETLKVHGLPSRRIESWHYTDLRTLLKGVAAFDDAAESQSLPALLAGSTVLTVNNGVALNGNAPEGVTLAPVRDELSNGSLLPQLGIRGTDDA